MLGAISRSAGTVRHQRTKTIKTINKNTILSDCLCIKQIDAAIDAAILHPKT